MTWQYSLTGLLVGTLVGLTGMGGGSLMTPILVLLWGVSPTVAIGSDIAHGAIFKTVGAVQHRRMGNVRARLAGWMFVGSAPASLAGVWLAQWIEEQYGGGVESGMGRVLGAALILGSIGLVAKTFSRTRTLPDDDFELRTRDKVAAVLIGVFGGFVVGLTSVGSGVFFGLTLLVLFPLRALKVVGTDIFHAAALLYVAGFGHFIAGNVDLSLVGWLLIGSIPGVLIGGRLSLTIPEQPLRLLLALVLGLSGLRLIDVPGAAVIIVVVLSVVGVALLMHLSRIVWLRRRTAAPPPASAAPDGPLPTTAASVSPWPRRSSPPM